jgi:hypothetical protein
MTALVRTCLLIAVLTAVPALAADSGQATPAARLTVAPVEIDGNVLFELRGATTLPAPRRAGRVRDRIVALAADPAVRVDELQVVMTADYAKIMAGDQAILSLVDADAQPFEVNLHVLADLYPDGAGRHRGNGAGGVADGLAAAAGRWRRGAALPSPH